MKRMMACLGLLAVLTQAAGAWRPSGWVYMDWPWAYDSVSGDWQWFKTDDVQWVHGYPPADGWKPLGESGLKAGWIYASWPFAYAQVNGAWYYVNEVDTQWVVNMQTGTWSLFGVPAAPAGMVFIPGGTNAGTDPDIGVYSLTVQEIFMDKYEVTAALWNEVKAWNGGNGYLYSDAIAGKAPTHPVGMVSWYDGLKWCNARSEQVGREPVYYTDAAFTQVYKTGEVATLYLKDSADGFRLPTGDQWHYAARGGVNNHRFPWHDSDEIQHDRCNYWSSSALAYDTSPTAGYHPAYNDGTEPYTSPVGSFAPNGYGLFDMAGNVWEWCWDAVGANRMVRGGSWGALATASRVSEAADFVPSYVFNQLGFRTVLPTPK